MREHLFEKSIQCLSCHKEHVHIPGTGLAESMFKATTFLEDHKTTCDSTTLYLQAKCTECQDRLTNTINAPTAILIGPYKEFYDLHAETCGSPKN